MSLRALTLCGGVKIIRVIRVESWEFFSNYFRNGLEYSNQTLHADIYYGGEVLIVKNLWHSAKMRRGKGVNFMASY